jgi:hypothetical protein
MTETEIVPLHLIEQLDLVERVGDLSLKGYTDSNIAEICDITPYRAKQYKQEYLNILQNRAENDPYFLERVQYNTIKHLAELDSISKEAWETVEISTQNGLTGTRIQALKLALDITTKKAQLHQLMGSSKSTDSDYLTRMQKSEQVNQMLSRVLRDVVSECDNCREKARILLAEAMALMTEEEEEVTEENGG